MQVLHQRDDGTVADLASRNSSKSAAMPPIQTLKPLFHHSSPSTCQLGSRGLFSIVVRDYDEAIAVQAMDSSSPTRRNLLHCAGSTEQKTPSQEACIGNQTGGRVWLVLETSDFWGDYEAMQVAGVRFSEVPRT
ncbi:hypothetical protein H257_02992 [Aphanomyces astaci]|uniref:Uncharacterized protein n=1 Tax=Aphanomyces astaci TaxID=112090 RepID=W4H1M8_APHAT|nr:hypothetical protein H257_02992 [Aphanomyces astaci]ETV85149.1 hypothetical protein H257_02992 [Aphanomyces astaci]|eukprot:XP_009825167.1 hypothetical protein H257_02992 [Aphanomyces astaci]